MARRAGRDVAAGIAKLDQAHDRGRRFRKRLRIWIALRLRRVICRDVGQRRFIQRLCEVRHLLMRAAARTIVIQLLVNGRARLTGKMRKFGRHRHALRTVTSDTNLFGLGTASV
jgi:hypothetical protein